jgi:hypothetical protein
VTAVLAPVVTEPGLYDLTDEQYHADPVPEGSLSTSGAKLLLPPGCPALYRYRRDHPENKRVFDLGKAAHKIVLGTGPELATVDADDWRTKAARQQRDDAYAAGKVPVLKREVEDVLGMADAIRRHPTASTLFDRARGTAEQSLFWRDAEFDVWRRSRFDWLPNGISSQGRLIIPDYKTCDAADDESVMRAVHRYRYHLQAAFYSDAARAVGLADQVLFLFVFQERRAPYLINVVELDVHALAAGRELIRRALATYAECAASDRWPGYSDDRIGLVALPPWA